MEINEVWGVYCQHVGQCPAVLEKEIHSDLHGSYRVFFCGCGRYRAPERVVMADGSEHWIGPMESLRSRRVREP